MAELHGCRPLWQRLADQTPVRSLAHMCERNSHEYFKYAQNQPFVFGWLRTVLTSRIVLYNTMPSNLSHHLQPSTSCMSPSFIQVCACWDAALCLATEATCHLIHSSTTYKFASFTGNLGGADAWAGSMSSMASLSHEAQWQLQLHSMAPIVSRKLFE
jgi:hypothetical protein